MFKIRKSKDERNPQIFWAAFLFLFFFLLFESYYLKSDYSGYVIYLADSGSFSLIFISLFFAFTSIYLIYRFLVLGFSASPFYKFVCFLLFCSAIFVEYGYQKALGRLLTVTDIENAFTVPSDQAVASFFLYFNYVSLIPCAFFLLCLILIKNKGYRFKANRFFIFFIYLGIFYIALVFLDGLIIEREFPSSSVNAFCRVSSNYLIANPASSGSFSIINGNRPARLLIKKPKLPDDYRPNNNVIVVVDESVRGDHLSLNGYYRKTTPFLDELASRQILYNWGVAVSASTGSRFTYNALITGLRPGDFPEQNRYKEISYPTMFQFAKAMSYKTYFFDGQMKEYWGGIPDDMNYIDHWSGVSDLTDDTDKTWNRDNLIAKKINGIITNSSGNFIFVFKHGDHIPYDANFPSDEEKWKPSYKAENVFSIPSGDQLEQVDNAYDNSIAFNLDSFFKNLVDDYSDIPNNTVIIYTGDHGQTLFANGRASHGGDTKEEAEVPLFLIGKLVSAPDTDFKASHENLFPTVMDLIGYPQNLLQDRFALSLLKATINDSKPRFYNPNLNAKISFDN